MGGSWLLLLICLVQCPLQTLAIEPGDYCTTSPNDCDSTKTFLQCTQFESRKLCVCEKGAHFHYTDSKCISVDFCRSNHPQPDNSVCVGGKVECVNDFTKNQNGKCVKGYDKSCTLGSTTECDPDAYLECDGGTCLCNPNSHWDDRIKSCSRNADEDCSDSIYNPTYPPYVSPSQCTQYSTCQFDFARGDDFCTCQGTMERNSEGKCRVPLEKSCEWATGEDICDETQFLKCNATSVCTCEEDLKYHFREKLCVYRANDECLPRGSPLKTCVDQADCTKTLEGPWKDHWFCRCQLDLVESQQGECKIPHGGYCDDSNPIRVCDDDPDAHQECIKNKCTCKGNNWYDENLRVCQILVGNTCKVGATTLPCVPGATCISTGTCHCDPTLLESHGFCVLPHNSTCNPENSRCDHLEYMECNKDVNACLCAGQPKTVYEDGRCRIRAEHPCEVIPGQETQECIKNSDCTNNKCTCKGNLASNGIGQCVIPHGQSCGDGIVGNCDKDYGHQFCAPNGLCNCNNPEDMDYKDGQCVIRKGKACSSEAGSAPCDLNLACDEGACECDKSLGLVDDGNGNCVKVLGSPCKSPTECNSRDFITCRDDVCSCFQGYTSTGEGLTATCVGNYRSKCNSNANCNRSISVACSNGECVCAGTTEQEFDNREHMCLTRLYGTCHVNRESVPDDEVPLICNWHSFLSCLETSGGKGTCRCQDGYEEFSNVCVGGAGIATTSLGLMLILFVLKAVTLP